MQMSDANDEWDFSSPEYLSSGDETETGSTSVDWTSIVDKAISTWGSVEVASQQADIAKTQAQYGYRYPSLPTTTARLPGGTVTYPGYGVPQNNYGAPAQNDTWLMLAAAGIVAAAYLFTRK